MDISRAERWSWAKNHTEGYRNRKRGVLVAIGAGLCSVFALLVTGSQEAGVQEAVAVGAAIVGAYALLPLLERLYRSAFQAPVALRDDALDRANDEIVVLQGELMQADRTATILKERLAEIEERSLNVVLQPLPSDPVPRWNDEHRVRARVRNLGPAGRFYAKLCPDVKGIDVPGYPELLLQWNTLPTAERDFHEDDAWILHIARVTASDVWFCRPQGLDDQPVALYNKVSRIGDIHGEIEIRDASSGKYHRTPFVVTVDRHHVPHLKMPEELSGDEGQSEGA